MGDYNSVYHLINVCSANELMKPERRNEGGRERGKERGRKEGALFFKWLCRNKKKNKGLENAKQNVNITCPQRIDYRWVSFIFPLCFSTASKFVKMNLYCLCNQIRAENDI